jgi:F420-non-reducing hydrogenase iron-sulfur subunit
MNEKAVKIDVFYCITGYDQSQLARSLGLKGNKVNVISLPCSGKLDILYLVKAFETGADGVAVMICKEGECRYLEGNMRARKRVEAIENLIEEAGLGKGRATVIQLDDGGIERAVKKLDEFCIKIAALAHDNKAKALQS